MDNIIEDKKLGSFPLMDIDIDEIDMKNSYDWPSGPDDFLDSIFSLNGDLLTEFDDPNIAVNNSEVDDLANSLMEKHERISPISSLSSDFNGFADQTMAATGVAGSPSIYNSPKSDDDGGLNEHMYHKINRQGGMSSGASDSGLSSDNLDLDTNLDYQALSPALSSPGPSISERGGSPQRYIQVIQQSPSSSPKQQSPHTPQPIYIKNNKVVSSAAFKKYNKTAPKVVVEKVGIPEDALMFNKDALPQQQQQFMNVKTLSAKEVKIYRVASTANNINYLTPAITTTTANGQQNKINGKKVTAIQFRNGAKTRTVSTTNGDAVVMSKGMAPGATTTTATLNGVRKVIRVQNTPTANPRSILLPVAFQDIKDLRTIKIVNASNFNKKSPNIKLAAANMLQQSKQGLMPKNVIVTKDQLMEDSTSMSDHTSGSDGESFAFEDLMKKQQPVQSQYRQQTRPSMDDDDDDDEDDDDDDTPMSGNQMNGDVYQKLVLTAEEKRLLAKEGISLPQCYPLTKHEERELKRIRRKIRNKKSAQDSRKRKKEYVDGLEERVKQCTDENQSLLKRIKMLQNQNQDLMSQMKKLQTMLTKGTNKTTQPATCLMILLLSMALVAVPNLKLGQNRQQQSQEAELADVIQENILQQQNRRSLLFDTKNPQQMDLVDEELNYEDIMMFGADKDDTAEMCGLKPAKRTRSGSDFIDYDVDDSPWYRGGGGEQSNAEFKLAAEEYQKSGRIMQSSGFNIQSSPDDLSVLLSPNIEKSIAAQTVKDVTDLDVLITPPPSSAEPNVNASHIHSNKVVIV